MDEPISTAAELSPGDLRLMALSLFARALRALSLSDDSGAATVRREPPPLLRLRTEEEEAAALRALVNRLREDRPMVRLRLAGANKLVQQVLDSPDVDSAWGSLQDVRAFIATLSSGSTASAPPDSSFQSVRRNGVLRIESIASFAPGQDLADALERDLAEQRFVASVMQLCQDYRSARRSEFSPDDELAVERAYRLLDEGVRLPRNFLPILHTAGRTAPTYLSFADPGEGHLAVTVRDADLLDGLIVHVEYIDRDNVENKELVEAYRLPAVRNAARVRLHVGGAAPVTAFIGRPVFEGNNYDLGLLKAGHTMASVCSAMFSHGVADCKIAMDRMTARQAVDFMRVVAGNVVRNPVKQRLSAAFNINTPIVNDLISRGAPQTVTDPAAIAELAATLAHEGKFNKVAWDGASNGPSKPIIGQLSRAQLLKVAHAAHEYGLETYISAGMEAHHMRDAVFLGIGGVGIGTSLHFRDEVTGAIGEIDPAKVRAALDFRKKASESVEGIAAAQLARLDWRYAEETLTPQAEKVRHLLFDALSQVCRVLDGAAGVKNVPDSAIEMLKRLSAEAQEALSPPKAPAAPADATRSRYLSFAVPLEADTGAELAKPGRLALRSDDLVEEWARRALAASEAAAGARSLGLMDPEMVEHIRTLLQAGDRDGLRLLYLR
jgi:hypothetical protein